MNINPYLIIAALMAWLGSVVAVGYWQHEDGVTVTDAAYAKRDNVALKQANKAILDGEVSARKSEQRHAEQIAVVSTAYEGKLKNAEKKTSDLLAAARAGTFSLRDPGTIRRIPVASGVSETATAASGCDGSQKGEFLSRAATEFLVKLASDADRNTEQLAACQSVIRADREP